MIPNPIKKPKEFGKFAVLAAVLIAAASAILGAAALVFPFLRTSLNRQGTGIRVLDENLNKVGQKVGNLAG